MYTRGQLVLIGNIGRKAIRFYEQEGLISSQRIDPVNGYHYYIDEQILRIEKIKKYKKLGFSIAEIKGMLIEGISEAEMLAEKKNELEHSIKEMQSLIRSIESLGKEMYEVDQKIEGKIEQCEFKGCSCLFIEENVEHEKLGISVGKLYEKASRNKLVISGAHFVKYEGIFSEDMAFKMTTCLPVTCNEIDGLEVKNEAQAICLRMHFTEGFSKIGKAHQQMKKYIEENNSVCTGVVYEVYHQDMSVDIYYELEN